MRSSCCPSCSRAAAQPAHAVIAGILAALEGPLRGAPPLDRLTAVVAPYALGSGAAAFAISEISPCGRALVTRQVASLRPGRRHDLKGWTERLRPLAELPAAARAVDELAPVLVRDDPRADPADRELLLRWEFGQAAILPLLGMKLWVIELFAPTGSPSLADLVAPLRLLGQTAVGTPPHAQDLLALDRVLRV